MKWNVFSYVVVSAVMASGVCFAQEALLVNAVAVKSELGSSLTAQEKAPTKPYMNMAMAQKMLEGAVAYAKKVDAPGGSIAIVDDGGHLIR